MGPGGWRPSLSRLRPSSPLFTHSGCSLRTRFYCRAPTESPTGSADPRARTAWKRQEAGPASPPRCMRNPRTGTTRFLQVITTLLESVGLQRPRERGRQCDPTHPLQTGSIWAAHRGPRKPLSAGRLRGRLCREMTESRSCARACSSFRLRNRTDGKRQPRQRAWRSFWFSQRNSRHGAFLPPPVVVTHGGINAPHRPEQCAGGRIAAPLHARVTFFLTAPSFPLSPSAHGGAGGSAEVACVALFQEQYKIGHVVHVKVGC